MIHRPNRLQEQEPSNRGVKVKEVLLTMAPRSEPEHSLTRGCTRHAVGYLNDQPPSCWMDVHATREEGAEATGDEPASELRVRPQPANARAAATIATQPLRLDCPTGACPHRTSLGECGPSPPDWVSFSMENDIVDPNAPGLSSVLDLG
jgi:hypothetical protein